MMDKDHSERFDVAISFAGDQRHIAEEFNQFFKSEGIRSFYDFDYSSELWGKNLAEHLPTIYTHESKFVLILASQGYFEKVWTKVERRAALSRMLRSDREFILIYKIGDVSIPIDSGLSEDLGYISDRQFSPSEAAALVLKKLGVIYTFDEIVNIVVEFVHEELCKEHFDPKHPDGLIPWPVLRANLCNGKPKKDERWSVALRDYLGYLYKEGMIEVYDGMFYSYRLSEKYFLDKIAPRVWPDELR